MTKASKATKGVKKGPKAENPCIAAWKKAKAKAEKGISNPTSSNTADVNAGDYGNPLPDGFFPDVEGEGLYAAHAFSSKSMMEEDSHSKAFQELHGDDKYPISGLNDRLCNSLKNVNENSNDNDQAKMPPPPIVPPTCIKIKLRSNTSPSNVDDNAMLDERSEVSSPYFVTFFI